jgi:hypothetical protein
MSHTPGPWSIAPHSDRDEVLDVVADYKDIVIDGRSVHQAHWIAECDSAIDSAMELDEQETALDTMRSNASLIAAAPDLLAALKECAWRLGALALASGDFSEVNAKAIDLANAAITKAEGQQTVNNGQQSSIVQS